MKSSARSARSCFTTPRRGLVSVAMLIGLIILGLVTAGLLKVAMGRRTLVQIEEHQLQADALADSGIDRALARLEAQPGYEGEVWEIPTADLGGRGQARITIKTEPAPGRADFRQVVVTAEYLVTTPGPVRRTRTIVLPASTVTR